MSLHSIQAVTVREVSEGVSQTMSVHEYFTCGRCWELAEALHEITPGSRIIEIRISNGSWSMLRHAGVEVAGHVIDIEGRHETADWIARWSSAWEKP